MADVNIHASNRQIWYRHPNSEAGNDEIQNDIFFSQTNLTRTGIISNSYNEMFEA
jgi:hypothetical protein